MQIGVISMIVSLMAHEEENDCHCIELYNRKSFTCRVLIGTLKFQEEKEKKALLEMLMESHPHVSLID